ncbi:glycosyltransferase family 2 protein [Frankia sp. Cpl3]|nr:glycosyltransferase family 2 protein [Frankia sp. Cpl3]
MDLQRAVASIVAQPPPADEIILVTDHNEALRRRARAAFTGVDVIVNTGPRGLSGARNTGVARATSEVVAFLDDDAHADAHWLARLVRPYADPAVQGTGGLVVPAWPGGRPRWFPPEFDWVVGCSYPGLPRGIAPIRNPIGAAMSLRRSAWTAVAGFTDGLGRLGATPLGCEETEFYIRVRRDIPGAAVLHVPDAVVTHQIAANRATWRYFRSRCLAEGLSKAIVSGRVGAATGLASERAYVRSVLPRAVARDLRRRGDRRRAAAVVAGLALTTSGYARGRLQGRPVGTLPSSGPVMPTDRRGAVWTGEMELADPLGAPRRPLGTGHEAPSGHEARTGYDRARVLARWQGVPVGFVVLDLLGTPAETTDGTTAAVPSGGGITPEAVWSAVVTDLPDELARVRAEVDRLGPLATAARHSGAGRADSADNAAGADTVGAADGRVSVVVCTRNRAGLLPGCLERLRALRHPDLEIIIVDNAPSDSSTWQAFQRTVGREPRFRYVREDRPGLSHARNRGLSAASGAIIAFTDDDVAVDPWWVAGLTRGFARRADVACVTGLVPAATLDSAAERHFDARVSWGSSCRPRVYDAHTGPSVLHPFAAGLLGTGASFAVRTAVLRGLGGFDTALGAGTPTRGGEDLDLFLRVLLDGHALAYEPSAVAWHGHRADLDALRRQLFGYGTGLSAYLAKHLSDRRSRRRMIRQIPAAAGHLRALTARGGAAGTGHPTSASASAVGGAGHLDNGGRASSVGLPLAAREWLGFALGPVCYARSLHQQRSLRRPGKAAWAGTAGAS